MINIYDTNLFPLRDYIILYCVIEYIFCKHSVSTLYTPNKDLPLEMRGGTT